MTAPVPGGPAAEDPFARARTLLEPEAGRRHAPAGTGPRGGRLRWALPHTPGDLSDSDVHLGPMSSGKAPSDADRIRAQLTAEGASFREETALRGGREVTEFHVERPEASQ